MKRVLITGISGFLGKSLVGYFNREDDIKIFGHSREVAKTKALFHAIGIEILAEVNNQVLNDHKIDAVIHLAGIAHDFSGKYRDEDYFQVNAENTKALYDHFLKSGASAFIFVSSIKAVVDCADQEIDETHKEAPKGAYGKSKLMAEQYLSLHQPHGKMTYVLRPCMVHGPGNKGNLNLLYKFVKWGIPFPLGAFDNRRSFLSIENFCMVVEQILAGELPQGTYHLADSEPLSTNDLVKLIGRGIGKKVIILKIPIKVIMSLATFGSILHLPFGKENIAKLTENMVVSNKKLLLNLGKKLPVSAEEGLLKTIKSLDE